MRLSTVIDPEAGPLDAMPPPRELSHGRNLRDAGRPPPGLTPTDETMDMVVGGTR
jgi:hypothetical protein